MLIMEIQGKKINIFKSHDETAPTIYLNTFSGEGDKIYQSLTMESNFDCTLIEITNLNWEHDLSPWSAPAIMKNDSDFTGGADEYLALLTNEIIPKVEVGLNPKFRGLAGYSMAGLFAVYAPFLTDKFSRIASMSGSMWFPNFVKFFKENQMKQKIDKLYLSLGDKESKTKNQYLSQVQFLTEDVYHFCKSIGISSEFVLNPGGHLKDVNQRQIDGLKHILSN
ncbi:MAG: alpha/beta hydrolase [Selenomonadaceae bacterium]|nr:alpha/beta hydrolase [Selenomonadaceae bacterium]